MEEKAPRVVNRRGLLRRASAVAAGVGAAGVATGLIATPAEAAVGNPVTAGATVDAGGATTEVTNNSAANPTLRLANPSGPSLELAPAGNWLPADAPQGAFNATNWGDLEFVSTATYGPQLVYTSDRATQTWPVKPFRALDTRGLGGVSGNGRELILNPGVLNGAGKLQGGNTLLLNLTDFVNYGWAVLGNATVQAPEANGYVTVFPGDLAAPPNTSSLNFFAGWPVSNSIFCALGDLKVKGQSDVIGIYSPNTTHLIFDVTGFVVASIYNIVSMAQAAKAAKADKSAAISADSRAAKVREFLSKH